MEPGNTNTNDTATATDAVSTDAPASPAVSPELQEAVNIASDLLVLSRDQKNTGITLITAPAEEVAAVKSFIARGRAQQDASKNIYALSLAKAKERNAGRKLPPSKQKKAAGK